MDVPWQCQRCSLHNISNICAACSAPRPDPMSNDSDEERASLLGRSPDGARPPAVPSRFSGSRSRFGGPDVGDAAGGTSPDELGPIPGGAGFNPAELPQEFTGIGQQQPPEVPLPPRNGFLGIPVESIQQMTTFFASSGYCVPFLALMFTLFMFRHLFGIFMFLSTWNSMSIVTGRIREEIERKDASRKHIIAVFGFLCFGMGALITVLCWKDGLRGLWTFDPNLMLYDAAAGAGIVLPAPAVVSGPAKFTSKANEDLSHLYHSALEDVFSIWNVLWLVSMNHLIVKFYLAGFRALVFTFDCSSVNGVGWLRGNSASSVSLGSATAGSAAPNAATVNDTTHASAQFKLKKRVCAAIDSIGAVLRAVVATPAWMCFYQVYGGGDLTFDDWKEFAIVYLIIKIIVLTTQTKQIVKQFRELCADGLTYGRVPSPAEVLETSSPNCSICLAALDNPVALPCNHMFCRACIEEWLDRERNCPNCRRDVPGSSPTVNDEPGVNVLMSLF